MKKFANAVIVILLILGAFLRIYNLNWGSPFYFHPDERNIANAITILTFPSQMNPHFFAYGSFPIYFVYFMIFSVNFFRIPHADFTQAIFLSRVCSTILSFFLIPSLYFIGKYIKNRTAGIIASFFCIFSTGFIQFAHFATFEMWLTFFSLWLYFSSLKIVEKKTNLWTVITGILFGLLIGIKVSSIALIIVPFTAIFIQQNIKRIINLRMF
jgi:4-amino-4-deoxy-L-arabinose transferase-like glycosyltransferase